jgi:hypothetical protein
MDWWDGSFGGPLTAPVLATMLREVSVGEAPVVVAVRTCVVCGVRFALSTIPVPVARVGFDGARFYLVTGP